MAPVLFAYGGWQTASFVSGELRDPQRDLPRGLLLGVGGVIAALPRRELGLRARPGRTGAGRRPRPPPRRSCERALGAPGARLIAAGIAISTLGFLSQSDAHRAARLLRDGARTACSSSASAASIRARACPCSRSRCRALFAMLLTAWGQYRQILDYVIAVDFIFFGLTATCLFVFRRRDAGRASDGFRTPGHPWTTAALRRRLLAVRGQPGRTLARDTLLGMAILADGRARLCVLARSGARVRAPTRPWARRRRVHGVGQAPLAGALQPGHQRRGRPAPRRASGRGSRTSSSPGASVYGYAPLQEASPRKSGWPREAWSPAGRHVVRQPPRPGRAVEPGDEVLIEDPGLRPDGRRPRRYLGADGDGVPAAGGGRLRASTRTSGEGAVAAHARSS